MLKFKAYSELHRKEALISILLIAASTPTILWMWDRWFDQGSYYSHGILVPVVSIFLILRKKEALKKLPFEPSPWGLKLFLSGIAFYWASALLHVYFSSAFAMLLITAGIVLHFYGEKFFRAILFPLLFLIFMIPLPLIVVAFICFKLKILAAQLATLILNAIGLPAIRLSSLIKLRHSYVLVEDSCGGLKSLFALTALGSIFAYQLRSRMLNKILLFLSSIPIATVTNTFRIVFLSTIGELWGTEYARGILHDLSGYLVFAFSFLMLFAVKKSLE
ncbi:MAG: exosortase [Candidatus Omnitrophica bacterium]|nr:exosortase [Candidatus Omnitrophota bacterium]